MDLQHSGEKVSSTHYCTVATVPEKKGLLVVPGIFEIEYMTVNTVPKSNRTGKFIDH